MLNPLDETLRRLHARFAAVDDGDVATYIPELGRANPAHFAVVCATTDGHVYAAGDADVAFTIQSVSKPFVYGLALDDLGVAAVADKIGVEPSGEAFNAISLEADTGRPRNPMINAGAIATASLIAGETSHDKMARTLAMLSGMAGRALDIDEDVYRSEAETGHRNRAIAYLLRNAGIIGADVDAALDRYFMQCSVRVTATDLAVMAATLAAGGQNPRTGERVLAFNNVQRVLSVMSTCGMYDYAGSWLYGVGMPAKSGVSGGILAVLPGQLGIGVFSPRLDAFGNSVRGVAVCEALSAEFGLHLLRPPVQPTAVVIRRHTLAEAGSKRRRPAAQMREIARRGDDVRVLRLQGPLAFSTSEVALRQAAASYLPGARVVFDCARVDSVDVAASRLLQGFANALTATGGMLILAGLRDVEGLQGSAASEGGAGPLLFPDIDTALEWCEEQLIGPIGSGTDIGAELSLAEHPLLQAFSPDELVAISALMRRTAYEDRDVVVRQGEAADAIHLVVAGTATIQLNLPGERRHRLATLGAGGVFGELALLDGEPRTADVEAEDGLVCYALPLDALDALDETAPGVRAKLMTQIARDLAARLRRADTEIMTLAS